MIISLLHLKSLRHRANEMACPGAQSAKGWREAGAMVWRCLFESKDEVACKDVIFASGWDFIYISTSFQSISVLHGQGGACFILHFWAEKNKSDPLWWQSFSQLCTCTGCFPWLFFQSSYHLLLSPTKSLSDTPKHPLNVKDGTAKSKHLFEFEWYGLASPFNQDMNAHWIRSA